MAPVLFTDNRFVDSLPERARAKLTPHLQPGRLVKGAQLYFEGEPVESIYFPAGAVVSELQLNDDGRAMEVSTTGRNGGVGLTSILNGGAAVVSCDILIGGAAWRIGSDAVAELVRKEPLMASAVHRYAVEQLRAAARKITCNGYHTVQQRFCKWLLGIAETSGRASLKVTQTDAANALGVHRPTITYISLELQAAGLIHQGMGAVVLLNPSGLAALACECYTEPAGGLSIRSNAKA